MQFYGALFFTLFNRSYYDDDDDDEPVNRMLPARAAKIHLNFTPDNDYAPREIHGLRRL